MDHDRELDLLVALLEEHELTPEWESEEFHQEPWGYRLLYERVRQTPYFPMSVAEVREILERRRGRFSEDGGSRRAH